MSNPVCDSEADSIPVCHSEVEADNISFANSDDLNWLKIDAVTPTGRDGGVTPTGEEGGLSRDNTLKARDDPSQAVRVSCFHQICRLISLGRTKKYCRLL